MTWQPQMTQKMWGYVHIQPFFSTFHFKWRWKPQRGGWRCFPPWLWFSFLPLIYSLTGVTWHIWKGLFPWNDLIVMLGFDVWCLSNFYDSTFPCICLLSPRSVSEHFATLLKIGLIVFHWTKLCFICLCKIKAACTPLPVYFRDECG